MSYLNDFFFFGNKCFILRDRKPCDKFDARSDDSLFLGHPMNSHAFCVVNKRTGSVIELVNVIVKDIEHKKELSRYIVVEHDDDNLDTDIQQVKNARQMVNNYRN